MNHRRIKNQFSFSEVLPLVLLIIIVGVNVFAEKGVPFWVSGSFVVLFFVAMFVSREASGWSGSTVVTSNVLNASSIRVIVLFIVVQTVALLVFRPFYNHEWMLLDDWEWMSISNGFYREWMNTNHLFLIRKWLRFLSPDVYTREISIFSLMSDIHFYGENLAGYHLTNVIIHGFNAFLLGLLVYRFTGESTLSTVTSFIALLNPLSANPVGLINGRGDLVCAFFIILTIIFHHAFLNYHSFPKRFILSLLSLFSAVAAMWSKEMALALPGIVFIVNLLFSPGKPRFMTAVIHTIPFIFLDLLKLANLSGVPQDGMQFGTMMNSLPIFLTCSLSNFLLFFIPSVIPGWKWQALVVLFLVWMVGFIDGGKSENRRSVIVFGLISTFFFMVPVYNFVTEQVLGNIRVYYLSSMSFSIVLSVFIAPAGKRIRGWIPVLFILLFSISAGRIFFESVRVQPDYSVLLRESVRKLMKESTFARIGFVGDAFDVARVEFFIERIDDRNYDSHPELYHIYQNEQSDGVYLSTLGKYPMKRLGQLNMISTDFFKDGPILWWSKEENKFIDVSAYIFATVRLPDIVPIKSAFRESSFPSIERWQTDVPVRLEPVFWTLPTGEIPFRIFITPQGQFPLKRDVRMNFTFKFRKDCDLRDEQDLIVTDILPVGRILAGERDFFAIRLPEHSYGRFVYSLDMQNYLSGNSVIADTTVFVRLWIPWEVCEETDLDVVEMSFSEKY